MQQRSDFNGKGGGGKVVNNTYIQLRMEPTILKTQWANRFKSLKILYLRKCLLKRIV